MLINTKKIACVVIIITMLVTSMSVAYAEDDIICQASLTASEADAESCTVVMSHDSEPNVVTKFLKKGWELYCPEKLNRTSDLDYAAIHIDIDDSHNIKRTDTLILAVEYYDKSNVGGRFAVTYDSYDGEHAYGGICKLEGTYTWKTAEFVLKNPKISNRLTDGNIKYDINLSLSSDYLSRSESRVVVRSVSVRLGEENPLDIKIKSDKTGNVFYNTPDTPMEVSIWNMGDISDTFTLNYNITNQITGSQIYCESESVYIPVGSCYNTVIDLRHEFGIFDIEVTGESSSGAQSIAKSEFSRVNAPLKGENINDTFGVATHSFSQYDMTGEEIMPMMARAGFGYVRDNVPTTIKSYDSGTDTCTYEIPEEYQKYIQNIREEGMEPLGIIGGGSFTESGMKENYPYSGTTTEDREKFDNNLKYLYDYVYNTALLLKDSVRHYQISNEYNIINTHNLASDYYEILKTCYTAIKDVDEDIKVIGGALAQMSTSSGRLNYIKELYDLGAGNYMDCLSIHFYVEMNPAEDTYNSGIQKELEDIHNIITDNIETCGDKELWVTEYCWRTQKNVRTPVTMAENLVKSQVLFSANGIPDRSIWYLFEGRLSSALDDTNIDYSIVRSYQDEGELAGVVPGSARPAYLTASNYAKLMNNCIFKEDNSSGSIKDFLFFDEKNNANIRVLWSMDGEQNIIIPKTDNNELVAIDMYGNESELASGEDGYELTIDKEPRYIIPKIPKASAILVQDDLRSITLSGVVDTDKPVEVACAVLYPNKTVKDFENNPITSSAYLTQITTDSEGRFTQEIELGGEHGEYTILYRPQNGDIQSCKVRYYSTRYDTELSVIQDNTEIAIVSGFDPAKPFDTYVKVYNGRALKSDCVFITAFYKDDSLVDSKLLDASVKEEESIAEFKNTIPLTLESGAQVDEIRLIMIDSFKNLIPLATAKSVSKQ